MRIHAPIFALACFVALSMFYYFKQKIEIRKATRRARLQIIRQEYLEHTLKTQKKRYRTTQNINLPKNYVHKIHVILYFCTHFNGMV
jgi:hypothetical protein